MLCYSEPASGCKSYLVMLIQWLWIMVCYAEAVVVNQVVLFWTSGCESWWIMLWKVVVNHDALPVCWAQWLGIIVCSVKPSDCELWCIMLRKVVVNHGVLFWASGCESWCAMLSQCLWMIVSYAEPVVAIYVVLCWASGCESLCALLWQWLWIMVGYTEAVVVNHGV